MQSLRWMRSRLQITTWIAAALFAACSASWVQAATEAPTTPPVPTAAFFKDSDVGETLLSPDGHHLAMTSRGSGVRRGLFVLDLRPGGKVHRSAQFRDADVVSVAWVNAQRLVFSAVDYSEGSGRGRGAPGLIAVDLDGENMRQLIRRQGLVLSNTARQDRSLDWDHFLLRVPQPAQGAGPNTEVLIGNRGTGESGELSAQWLDVYSGLRRAVDFALPKGTQRLLTDSTGQARVAFTLSVKKDAQRTAAWWRGPNQTHWQQLAEGDLFGLPFEPHSVDDAGQLYVTERVGAEGVRVLKHYDFEAGKPAAEPFVSSPGFDFSGTVLRERGSGIAQGVRLTTDAETTVWLDPQLKALQAVVDQRLPNQINRLQCSRCGQPDVVALVRSFSDRNPGTLWLYRGAPAEGQAAWQPVAQMNPGVQPTRMATVDFHRIRARDGRDLPVWLTTPTGPPRLQPPAAVVLVHGGPWVRGGAWAWRPMAQFLASRGYLVIEPEFRGSTGYGEAHFKAGWKQWGQAMQDDVADALQWAQAQKLAGPQACIMGGSYGGYATLMGLVRHPELYRCGIAYVAVTDLKLLLEGSWFVADDISEINRQYTLPQMVGDLKADTAMIHANSPVEQAGKIKAPLLLAMGELDRRVPLAHGKRMRDALEAAGNPPQWVVYPGEGHGWGLLKNRVDFAERIERFLAQHLAQLLMQPPAQNPTPP